MNSVVYLNLYAYRAESNGTCASANSTNILCGFSNNVIVCEYGCLCRRVCCSY